MALFFMQKIYLKKVLTGNNVSCYDMNIASERRK